jgi:hypothetical protein
MLLRRSLPFAAALALLVAARLDAGLYFKRAPAPEGADVAALAGDGTRLFAATIRGVWEYESGTWSFDGLGDKTLTSVAVAGGTAFAADGANVYRRNADGSWSAETLPSASAFPTLLAASGGTLFAAGVGAYRREGSTWSALPPPPGGLAHAIAVTDSGDLVLGFGDGTAARFTGGAWSSISGGVGLGEAIQALTTFGGILYAGTQQHLYAQSGSAWMSDTAFGTHDVRALTSALGTLRAATADAGVFSKGGSSWTNESGAFITFLTKSFGTSATDLYVGTGGGPVYRYSSGSWSEAKEGLDAAIVTDVVQVDTNGGAIVATSGAGAQIVGGSTIAIPPGCGNLVGASDFGAFPVFGSNPCGAVRGGTSPQATTSGLPAGFHLTAFSGGSGHAFGSTSSSGIFRFDGPTWSWTSLNSGISDTASVQTVRSYATGSFLFERTYAGVGGSVAVLNQGTWTDVSTGLPGSNLVFSLADTFNFSLRSPSGNLYAGLSAGGVWRWSERGAFVPDAAGITTRTAFSLDLTAQGLVAATGPSGVYIRRGGGWVPETTGLPAGADVRVARRTQGPTFDTVYAGTAGSGLFSASTVSSIRTVPVILDVVGNAGAHFRTELTIGSGGARTTIQVTFTPAPGFGEPQIAGGTITTVLDAGTELHLPDALDWLRQEGLSIPPATPASPIAGTLSIAAGSATDSIYAIARTYTAGASGGTYGLFYDAPTDLEAAEDEGYVYGLRSIANAARSNLALAHIPGRSTDPITLSVQVYAANGAAAGAPISVTLAPGEWHQLNGILPLAGLADGSFGYVRITRTSGIGPWTAYGVVNDAKTSDGSYLPLFRPGGVTAARKLLVPVVLDVFGAAGSHFTTELTIVNDGAIATPVDLFYQPAPGGGSGQGVPFVTVNLAARQQLTIADAIQFLRDNGVHVPSATTGAQVGTLEASFRFLGNLDAPRTVVLARTSTPNPNAAAGGTFGLFYSAIALGQGAHTGALVPALTENADVRSNLALVHAGGGSGTPITLQVQLFDSATGAQVGSTLYVTLNPGDWVQYSRVLSIAGVPGSTTRARAVITRPSGDGTFYAYGVLNDNVTSDGSFLSMISTDP